jgi:hypothetical protein
MKIYKILILGLQKVATLTRGTNGQGFLISSTLWIFFKNKQIRVFSLWMTNNLAGLWKVVAKIM